jgi:hypothetical protein
MLTDKTIYTHCHIDENKIESRTSLLYNFSDNENIKNNKEFFIAEYNSLRGEILQRISNQTTLQQICITAFGVIASYALDKIDLDSYLNVYLILVYPLLAYFISFAWAFNNTRICQIAEYLKNREKQVTKRFDFLGWENYVHDVDKKNKKCTASKRRLAKFLNAMLNSVTGTHKVKPGVTILSGTQAISIIIGIILIWVHQNHHDFLSNKWFFAIGFTFFDIVIFCLTTLTLSKSGKWEIISLQGDEHL